MKLVQKLATKYVKAKLRLLSLVSKKKAAKKALKLFSTPLLKTKVKTPAVFAKGEKLSCAVGDILVRGHRWLPKQQPLKKILITHGFESDAKKFGAYISAFIKKGYEVFAFDAPAHGESGSRQITLPLYISMIKKIDEEFGPMQSFMAHSFGGLATAHFLESVRHSEETKLALIAPATEMKTAIDNFFNFLELDEETRKEFDHLILEKTGMQPEYFSVRRAIKNIQAQVLWAHDKNDDITPISDVIKVKEEKHPNVQFLFTLGLGHRKIYRDEEVMKQVVEFL
jgi:pimeloyl-ACP methyl ester carboxylesterase